MRILLGDFNAKVGREDNWNSKADGHFTPTSSQADFQLTTDI
jgi:hypothetical protein